MALLNNGLVNMNIIFADSKDTSNNNNTTSNIDNNNKNTNNDSSLVAPLKTTNNNMNSKINKRLDRVPENLGPNGMTPSGKPRLFVCGTCTRAFARHEHLKRHERSHTKEKPFHCGVCQRKFSRRDLLLRHAQKLHAGCDDAIKRLRRRSSRSKSITEAGDELDDEDNDNQSTSEVNQGVKRIKLENSVENATHEQSFNHYLSKGLQFEHRTSANFNPSNANRNADFRNRRTSFSAASAANYASASNQQNYSEQVEFSTPQLLPVDHLNGQSHYSLNQSNHSDHQKSSTQNNLNSWMTSLNDIPGLDFLGNFSLDETAPQQAETHLHQDQNQALGPTQTHRGSTSSAVTTSSNGNHPRKRSKSVKNTKSKNSEGYNGNDIFGYSFYDDNYQLASQMGDFHSNRFTFPKLPSTYLNDDFSSNSTPNTGKFADSNSSLSLNKLNEYELLSDLEVPNHEEKILSVGYSFYESNDFASSTITPAVLGYSKKDNPLKRTAEEMDIDPNDQHFDSGHNIYDYDTRENKDEVMSVSPEDLLSSTRMFTQGLAYKISKVLEEYPFVGLPPPKLPSLDKMEIFVDNFKNKFSVHHPFIHKNYLNERAMYEYTFNEESPHDFTPFVCLPLLIGTIGALYSNDKKSAADLYEISRRCIHVYLDSRKKNDDAERSTTHNSPLWLVQSLVLSVLYGLFAEYDESDLSIILRQVNALCTLIRVSKFNLVKFNLENIEINEKYFKDYILYQSKIRTVFMIFNVSNILTAIYNLSPFIKYKELKCDLPDLENYWNCSNVAEFKVKCVENSSVNYNLNLERILNDMLMNIPINYKVSEFGANIVMFAVLQHFYYSKKNQLLNYSAGISPQHSNSSNIINNFRWENLLINENAAISIMLKNISVIRSLLIDLSRVKEMLWSRQWQKLAEEFVGLHCKNDDLLDACDYSIRTLCLIFINDEDSSNFKKSLSLSFQFVFFNFFHIAKFLYKFERRIFKHFKGQAVLKFDELREIPKYFSIYLKIAKFLADLEQIFIKNFDYHDENSKLALKDFDKSRYNFGTFPKLYETEYPKEVNLDQVLKVVKLKLSSNILKIGAFVFNHIFEKEMAFNIFKSLSEALNCIRLHIEREDAY